MNFCSKFQLGNKLCAAVLGESDILAKMFLEAVKGNVMGWRSWALGRQVNWHNKWLVLQSCQLGLHVFFNKSTYKASKITNIK